MEKLKTSNKQKYERYPILSCNRITSNEAVPWLRRIDSTSHHGGPGSQLGQSMWDLWWIKWQWAGFSASSSIFSLSVSFHRDSILMYHQRDEQ
jgi:hypothetical protein